MASESEKAEAARIARNARIFEMAGDVAKAVVDDRAVFLVSRDAAEIAAHIDAPALCIGSATADDLRSMEATVDAGGGFILYCAHGSETMLDRVRPDIRGRLRRVDLTPGGQRLFRTAEGDDPAPLRAEAKSMGGDSSHFWGTDPKFVAATFPNRNVANALAAGWRTTAYRNVLRAAPVNYSMDEWMALREEAEKVGGKATARRTIHDLIIIIHMPSERVAEDFAVRMDTLVWTR